MGGDEILVQVVVGMGLKSLYCLGAFSCFLRRREMGFLLSHPPIALGVGTFTSMSHYHYSVCNVYQRSVWAFILLSLSTSLSAVYLHRQVLRKDSGKKWIRLIESCRS